MQSIRAIMVTGGLYHEFTECARVLAEAFGRFGMVELTVTEDRDAMKREALAGFDAAILFTGRGEFTADQQRGLADFVRDGGGLLGLHSATVADPDCDTYIELLGGRFADHSPVHGFSVTIDEPDHPITARMADFEITDELYSLERFDPATVEVLASALWRGKSHPMVYVKQFGAGKVCYNALGHSPEVFANVEFQKLVHRGLRYVTRGLPAAKPRAAVVGYGGAFNMGKLHLTSAAEVGIEPAAVCDADLSRHEAAREDFADIPVYSDLGAMLAKEEFDLLTVITPHNTHADLAIQALEAGRHVIVEKPMAVSVRQCTDMIEAARRANRTLTVFHNRRWDGDYMAIRDLVRGGRLGEVFQLEATFGGYGRPGTWWRSDKQISGGLFFDWGAHFVDWLLGFVPYKIAAVDGFFHKKRWWNVTNEDHARVVVRYENGASALIEQSQLAWIDGAFKWRILGSEGGLALRNERDARIELAREIDGKLATTRIPVGASQWRPYYANVADHLIYGEPLAVSAESARRAIAVIETAERASQAGGPLPLPFEDEYTYDRWL